jgi:hypothetical protein
VRVTGARALLAVCAVVALTCAAVQVQLCGTTALFLGGTDHPLVDPDRTGHPDPGGHLLDDPVFTRDFVRGMRDNYLLPTAGIRGDEPGAYGLVAVYTPAAMRPLFGSHTFDGSVATGVANLAGCLAGTGCTAHAFTADELGDSRPVPPGTPRWWSPTRRAPTPHRWSRPS